MSGMKARKPFVDAATGIHYKAGDIVDESTITPVDPTKQKAADRLKALQDGGLIGDADAELVIGNANGVVPERLDIPPGKKESDVVRAVKPVGKPAGFPVGSGTPVQIAADKAAADKAAAAKTAATNGAKK
jgi:hypothetical protein